MAETPAGTQPEKADTDRGRAPRSTMPYYIAAFVAAAAMAWYFFLFVPANLDYFTGVRLRTLAVASSLVRNKAENLARALEKAPWCAGQDDADKYVRILLPEIQLTKADEVEPDGIRLSVPLPPNCAAAGTSSAAPRRDASRPAPPPAKAGRASDAKATAASASAPTPAPLRGTVTWHDLMAQAA